MKYFQQHRSRIIWLLVLGSLLYSRFVGLDWGLPYPMHPDEWNMARSVQELACSFQHSPFSIEFWRNCFDPHFYAYGQPPLYAARLLIAGLRPLFGVYGPIMTGEAIIALRILAATASVVLAWQMWRSYQLIVSPNRQRIWNAWLMVFSPGLIQLAHFGTTETWLMVLYLALLNRTLHTYHQPYPQSGRYLLSCAALLGAACAIKVSSAVFALPVILSYLFFSRRQLMRLTSFAQTSIWQHVLRRIVLLGAAGGVFVMMMAILSPHYLIHYQNALSAIQYESAIAMGQIEVFYTRAFWATIPGLYPLVAIFPVVFGLPFYMGIVGLLMCVGIGRIRLPRELLFVLLFIVSYFVATIPLFTKWTRFLAPIYPMMVVFCAVLFAYVWHRVRRGGLRLVLLLFFIGMLVPGVSYLRIYEAPDVRFVASAWMANHIPEDSLILSETANVADLPIHPRSYRANSPYYQSISFDFYNLDADPTLQAELLTHLQNADYIIVPSRRIFANHWCPTDSSHVGATWPRTLISWGYEPDRCTQLRARYPLLFAYYDDLFSGALGFELVAEFTSYPRLQLGGTTYFELPDEQYDETWSVFDHPVIRIYKKTSSTTAHHN